jgi:hypothetical protein
MPRDQHKFEPEDAWEPDNRPDTEKYGAEPFPMLDLSAMLRLPKPRFRIAGVLPEKGLGIVFGRSGAKKSFAAVDWSCHVAHAMDWHGHKTRQCGVLYIAGEDGYGIGAQRIPGWHIEHRKIDTTPPLRLIDLGVNITDKSEVARLLASIKKAIEETGFDIGLVVIDTLARSFGGRDENSGEAMALFLDGCRNIQRAIDGMVLVVHHSGWNDASRTRGHSSLWANTDARYQCDSEPKCPEVALNILHLKNGQSGAVFGMRTHTVELGTNDDGQMITTLVLKASEVPPSPSKTGPNRDLTPAQRTILDLIRNAGGTGLAYNRLWLQASTLPEDRIGSKDTLGRALKLLLDKDLVVQNEGLYFATPG